MDPCVPILVLTAYIEEPDVDRAQNLGTEYPHKPIEAENLRSFLTRCRTRARSSLSCLVDEIGQRHGLGLRQREVAEVGVECSAYDHIVKKLGIFRNTVKTHVATIQEHCGKPFAELVAEIRQACSRR